MIRCNLFFRITGLWSHYHLHRKTAHNRRKNSQYIHRDLRIGSLLAVIITSKIENSLQTADDASQYVVANKENVPFVPRLNFFCTRFYFNAINKRKFSMLSIFFLHMHRVTDMVGHVKQWRRCYREQIDTLSKVILHPNLGVEVL